MEKLDLNPRNGLTSEVLDPGLSFEREFAGSSYKSLNQPAGLSGLEEEEYIEIILFQRMYIQAQQGHIEELENELRKHDNPHTPSSKKRKRETDRNREEETEGNKDEEEKSESETDDGDERFPGKPKGSNGGGISIPEADHVERHILEGDFPIENFSKIYSLSYMRLFPSLLALFNKSSLSKTGFFTVFSACSESFTFISQ